MQSAEDIYVFRHALLREAAVQLQLPSVRARLNLLAFEIIEQLHGGRPQIGSEADSASARIDQTAIEDVALELYQHLSQAKRDGAHLGPLDEVRNRYANIAATRLVRDHRLQDAAALWLELAEGTVGLIRGEALLRAGEALGKGAESARAETALRAAVVEFERCAAQGLLGRATGTLALVMKDLSRMQEAEAAYLRALDLLRASGELDETGKVLSRLGGLYYQTGRRELAERAYDEALAILRQTGNRGFEALTLSNMALLYRDTGRLNRCEQMYEESLHILRELGDVRSEGAVLANQALILKTLGKRAQCEAALKASLEKARKTGDRRGEAFALGHIASGLLDEGKGVEALELRNDALAIHRETGDLRAEADALFGIGHNLRDLQRPLEAERCMFDALSLARKVVNPRLVAQCHLGLSCVYHDLARFDECRRQYEAAFEVFRGFKDPYLEGVTLGNMADLEFELGNRQKADEGFAAAIEILERAGQRAFAAAYGCSRALLWLCDGRREEAAALWARSAGLLRDHGEGATLERKLNDMRKVCTNLGVPEL